MLRRLFTRAVYPVLRTRFNFADGGTPRPSRLQRYAIIKEKNKKAKEQKRQARQLEKQEKLKNFEQSEQIQAVNCQGCSALLQHDRIDKYGYIEKDVFLSNLLHNRQIVQKSVERTDDTLRIIREVESQMNVEILKEGSQQLNNLDNLQVLMRIEEKQEESYKQRQTLVQGRWKRKELLCRRCFFLKNHNRLPEQFDNLQSIIDQTNEEQLLQRIFSKKGDCYYLYLVDVFDVCGTLTETVLKRLFLSKQPFSILLTKFDMVNKKYFNYIEMKPRLKQLLSNILDRMKQQSIVPTDYKIEDYLQHIYFVSVENKIGINKLKKVLDAQDNKVQLIGYPNTGKTSLLNHITSSRKPTSTVPGTSLSFQIGKYNKIKIFDCPGLYNPRSMVNLITEANKKSLLTWKQPQFAPGILTNSVLFYGGMIECQGIRVIFYGQGGARNIDKNNLAKWLLEHYDSFWFGLPPLNQLKIKRHQLTVEFVNMVGPDIEIAGVGFIGLRLCRTGKYEQGNTTKKIVLSLPEIVQFRLRKSLVLDNDLHNKTAVRKVFDLGRMKNVQ